VRYRPGQKIPYVEVPLMRSKHILSILMVFGLIGTGWAYSNLEPAYPHAWSENSGWINGLPNDDRGVVIGLYYASGYAWDANTGWIHFGDGFPANGFAYGNDGNSDYGINVAGIGANGKLDLRGLAWSPNTGWLVFESAGNPQVDPISGSVSGLVWSPNMGWVVLRTETFQGWEVQDLPMGPDNDGDTIPDPWELLYAGDLDTLRDTTDSDGDGQTDYEEFVADTDPLDIGSYLAIVDFYLPDGDPAELTFTSKPTRTYRILTHNDLVTPTNSWADVGLSYFAGEPESDTTTRAFDPGSSTDLRFFVVRAYLPKAP